MDHFQQFLNKSISLEKFSTFAILSLIISDVDNNALIFSLSKEEILDVLNILNADGVAGLDEFTNLFFQKAWCIIQDDVISAVWDFFKGSQMTRFFSCTCIALIPKCENPQSWTNFRPISMCTFFNKLVSKLMARRLRALLPKVILPNQIGFVKGRSIFDNVLLAKEIIHDIDAKVKEGNILLKLDISKAYDSISWKFLYKMLAGFGFSDFFIKLVSQILEHN